MSAIIDDTDASPRERLAGLVQGFFEMQGNATDHHVALQNAQALVGSAPAFKAFEDRVVDRLQGFLREAGCPTRDAAFHARFMFLVVTGIGERIGTRRLSRRELATLAAATTRMLVGFLGM